MKTPGFISLLLLSTSSIFGQTTGITDIERTVFYMKEGIEVFEKVQKEKTATSQIYIYYHKAEPQIIRFQKKEKLEKIVDWYYFEQILIYTESNWQDTTSGKVLFTEKTYHHNGSLIAWLTSENTFVNSTLPEYKSLERRLDTTAIHLREEFLLR
ncbi:hypothetical protein CNR22_20990 [Sphingobacteriaceae bacterium]|nr:hypothetical protein CNR22_20990 [Sphingobacteriaceae bacterium]